MPTLQRRRPHGLIGYPWLVLRVSFLRRSSVPTTFAIGDLIPTRFGQDCQDCGRMVKVTRTTIRLGDQEEL